MIAREGVSNIRTVAAFNAQKKVLSLFCNELRVPQRRSLRRSQTFSLLFGLSQLSLYASEALILWYGAHLVSKGVATFSKIIKVFVVLVITANSIVETVSLAPEIIHGGEALKLSAPSFVQTERGMNNAFAGTIPSLTGLWQLSTADLSNNR